MIGALLELSFTTEPIYNSNVWIHKWRKENENNSQTADQKYCFLLDLLSGRTSHILFFSHWLYFLLKYRNNNGRSFVLASFILCICTVLADFVFCLKMYLLGFLWQRQGGGCASLMLLQQVKSLLITLRRIGWNTSLFHNYTHLFVSHRGVWWQPNQMYLSQSNRGFIKYATYYGIPE